jgi:hypothetical protein
LGILLTLLILIAIVLFVTVRKSGNSTLKAKNGVEIKGLDGSVLLFSDDGVSYFKNGQFTFLSRSKIESLSFEKESEEIYKVVIKGDGKEITVPVKRDELSKLFEKTAQGPTSYYQPAVPWLGLILGTTAAFLAAELLEEAVESFSHHEEESHDQQSDLQNFDTGLPPQDEFDYFDTGDWFDDNSV